MTVYIKLEDLSESKQQEIRDAMKHYEDQDYIANPDSDEAGYINWDEFYIQCNFSIEGDITFE